MSAFVRGGMSTEAYAAAQAAAAQAAAIAAGLGVGQTWRDVKTTPGRVAGTTYYNTTGRPIAVCVMIATTAVGQPVNFNLLVDGVIVAYPVVPGVAGYNYDIPGFVVVGVGQSYKLVINAGYVDLWRELF